MSIFTQQKHETTVLDPDTGATITVLSYFQNGKFIIEFTGVPGSVPGFPDTFFEYYNGFVNIGKYNMKPQFVGGGYRLECPAEEYQADENVSFTIHYSYYVYPEHSHDLGIETTEDTAVQTVRFGTKTISGFTTPFIHFLGPSAGYIINLNDNNRNIYENISGNFQKLTDDLPIQKSTMPKNVNLAIFPSGESYPEEFYTFKNYGSTLYIDKQIPNFNKKEFVDYLNVSSTHIIFRLSISVSPSDFLLESEDLANINIEETFDYSYEICENRYYTDANIFLKAEFDYDLADYPFFASGEKILYYNQIKPQMFFSTTDTTDLTLFEEYTGNFWNDEQRLFFSHEIKNIDAQGGFFFETYQGLNRYKIYKNTDNINTTLSGRVAPKLLESFKVIDEPDTLQLNYSETHHNADISYVMRFVEEIIGEKGEKLTEAAQDFILGAWNE